MSAHSSPRLSLRQLKTRAKDLRRSCQARDPEALARYRQHHPRHAGASDAHLAEAGLTLQDAQLVIAREHGFDSWPKLTASLAAAAADAEAPAADPLAAIVGHSAAAAAIRRQLAQAAAGDMPVLLVGEKGAGKRLAASSLHEASGRRVGPFVQMSCDVAEGLGLGESELFGHEPGAFTGANAARRGRAEEAAGGTLLLNEVGALSPSAQLHLLEMLEGGVFRRLAGSEDIAAEARLVAAASRDLRPLVEAGSFREDLYYRLQVARVDLPPLRERAADIPDLARYFAAGAVRAGQETPRFSDEALSRLATHPWPGNLRQLRHTVEGTVAAAPGAVIEAEDLRLIPDAAAGGRAV